MKNEESKNIIKFPITEETKQYNTYDFENAYDIDEIRMSEKNRKTIRIVTGLVAFLIVGSIALSTVPKFLEDKKINKISDGMKSYSVSEFNTNDLWKSFDLEFVPTDALNAFLRTTSDTVSICRNINDFLLKEQLTEQDEKNLNVLIQRFENEQLEITENAILDYVKIRCVDSLEQYNEKNLNKENFSRVELNTSKENDGSRTTSMSLFEYPYEGCSYDQEVFKIGIKDKDVDACLDAWTSVNKLTSSDYTIDDKYKMKQAVDVVLDAIATIAVNDETRIKAEQTGNRDSYDFKIVKVKK